MKDHLVERLRAKAAKGGIIPIGDMTITEAADEIVRLRRQLTECQTVRDDWCREYTTLRGAVL